LGDVPNDHDRVTALLMVPSAYAHDAQDGRYPERPVPANEGYCVGVAPENCFYGWSFNEGRWVFNPFIYTAVMMMITDSAVVS
jgi:hypothetical protein